MKKSLLLLLCLCGLFMSCVSIPDGYSKTDSNSKIYSKYDEFKDVTWYMHEEMFFDRPCKIYYGETKGTKFARIVFQYNGDNWIFFNNATFVNNEKERVSFTVKSWDKTTNVNDGKVYEYVDLQFTNNDVSALQTVLNGTNVRLRLTGDKYKDYEISDDEDYVLGMKEIIESYLQ